MSLLDIVGTYDSFVIPIVLEKSTLKALLPAELFQNASDPFLPASELGSIVGKDIPDTHHLATVVLGRQLSTGLALFPKMTFQEAKFEIPFVKHPSLPEAKASFNYKQTMVFDSSFMAFNTRHVAGLQAKTSTFEPPDSPVPFEGEHSDPLVYNIKDAIETSLRHSNSVSLDLSVLKTLVSLPWYGASTKEKASKFVTDWDGCPIPPKSIAGRLRIRLPFFQSTSTPPGSAQDDEWTTFDDAQGWRYKASIRSQGPAKADTFL